MTAADRSMVSRLWQLYTHDLSASRGMTPNIKGLFRLGRLPSYLDDPDVAGWVVETDSGPVGFAFVSGLTGQARHMAEFFVVRAVRRQGVGSVVARELVATYPGAWEIGFQVENVGAPDFWRRVVTDLVGDRWQEVERPVPGKPHLPDDHFLVFRT